MDNQFKNVVVEALDALFGPDAYIAVLLKDIRDTNKEIASYFKHPPAVAVVDACDSRRLKLWDEAREVVIDGKVYKSNGNDCVPRPVEKITRAQVERAIMRTTDSRRDTIPTYRFADAVDNIMELIDGTR